MLLSLRSSAPPPCSALMPACPACLHSTPDSSLLAVECWEPGAGRWVELAGGSAMQQPRKYLGLADAGGRLVAVGGMTGARMRLQVIRAGVAVRRCAARIGLRSAGRALPAARAALAQAHPHLLLCLCPSLPLVPSPTRLFTVRAAGGRGV